MERILSMNDTPKANGSITVTLTASVATDITVPAGTRRIRVIVPATIGVRVRAGISGSASHTADLTTNVPSTSVYIDAVVLATDTDEQSVDMRFPANVTWLRVWNGTAGTPILGVEFSSVGNTPLKESDY